MRTRVHPLHSIWKSIGTRLVMVIDSDRSSGNTWISVGDGAVCVDVVPSPWWVYENGVR